MGISAPSNFGALLTVAETTVLGMHSRNRKKTFWDTHWVHKIILWDIQDTQEKRFGIRTGINTDPHMQYTGTSTSLQKKNISCPLREQEMARIGHKTAWRGEDCATNLKNEIPPRPPDHRQHSLCGGVGCGWTEEGGVGVYTL